MTVLKASSIVEAFSKAIDFLNSWTSDNPYCWFRGVTDNSLELLPGAYWRSSYQEVPPYVTFCQEASIHAKINKVHCWESYCLAQHHGIPTRLLDWTESFGAALFFAFDNWDETSTPCVWILRPNILNQTFLKYRGITSPKPKKYNIWLPSSISSRDNITKQDNEGYTYNNDLPLAIYPSKSNTRILAQQGLFTVHGRTNAPLDKIFKDTGGEVSEAFARIDLIGCDKKDAFRHLQVLGVRRSNIYPDLDNIVEWIKEEFGW